VVRREVGGGRHHYAVREFPGDAQVVFSSFEIALDIATRYARAVDVAVWHEEYGQFTLIESRSAEDTV